MIPLQIRITDHEATLTAAAVPYGVALLSEIDFAFIVDVDGDDVVMSPYEFACHSAVCAPPNKKGTGGVGGSDPKGGKGGEAYGGGRFSGGGPGTIGADGANRRIGAESHDADMATIIADDKEQYLNNHINPDGTLGLPFMKPGGAGTVQNTPEQDAYVAKQYEIIGSSREALVENLVKAGLDAIESPEAARAIKWYDRENQWGTNLANEYGVSVERVFATTSALSAMRKWGNEGTGTSGPSTNKGAIETILKKFKENEPFEVTKAMADSFNTYKGDKKGLGEGSHIEPGTYRPSDLSSVSIARLATGLGWKIIGPAGTRPVAAGIAILRGELSPNEMVRGTKQRSFVSNLAHPEIDYTSTNDLWHFRAVAGKDTLFNFPDVRKKLDGEFKTMLTPGKGNKARVTMPEYESWVTGAKKKKNKDGSVTIVADRGNSPHTIFTTSNPPTSGMYTEVTRVTRLALDKLAGRDVRFKKMKMHEFQALVWKYAGGNAGAGDE